MARFLVPGALLCPVVLGLALGGCASSAAFRLAQDAGPEPWRLAASELDSQRLFRVRLRSAEGKGRFRLMLRIENRRRYRIEATHPIFNRRLWSFDVDADQGLLVDYLQGVHCAFEGAVEMSALPMGPFPFESLPALLLGHPPLAPASVVADQGSEGLTYRDRLGRRWSVAFEGDAVVAWTLWRDDTPRVEWRIDGDWARLTAEENDLQLRWRETVREPAGGTLERLVVPEGSAAGTCDLGWIQGVEGTLDGEDEN